MIDHLVTAVVHLDVVARDAQDAETKARAILADIVEESALIGSASFATVRVGSPVNGETEFDIAAIAQFRAIGETEADAADVAAAMLEDEVMRSGFLSCGGVATVVAD